MAIAERPVLPITNDIPVSPEPGHNLLDNGIIARAVKSRWYPGVFRVATGAVFALVVYELLFGPSLAHENFGTAATWVLWWPLIPVFFILMGRFWCGICPFGTINDLVQKFVGNNRPVPKLLKTYGIWVIDAMFLAITWSDHVWGIVESPAGSGVLLLILTTGVVVSGALFQRRTWCRYLCFLGGLSGNYSRTGMVRLASTPAKCSKCTVAACYNGNGKVEGCPMFEFPRKMDSMSQCNFCGNCVKSCPNNSIRVTVRTPSEELWGIRRPKLAEASLAVVIMGIVFVQNITMLDIWKTILAWIENATSTDNYVVTFTITMAIAMLIPIALLTGSALIAGKSNRDSVLQNFARFGYAIIPLDVAAHVGHNLFHLLAEGKSVAFTALELFGIQSQGSTAILDNPTIQGLQFMLIGLGLAASLYTAYRITRTNYGAQSVFGTVAPYAVLLLLLSVANILLFSMPMEMRM